MDRIEIKIISGVYTNKDILDFFRYNSSIRYTYINGWKLLGKYTVFDYSYQCNNMKYKFKTIYEHDCHYVFVNKIIPEISIEDKLTYTKILSRDHEYLEMKYDITHIQKIMSLITYNHTVILE